MKPIGDAFEREQGCTEAEWLRWLPDAVHGHRLERPAPDSAVVHLAEGSLHLQWQTLPPRVIALIRLPRLQVRYRFDGAGARTRSEFMRRFDLHLQRGGG